MAIRLTSYLKRNRFGIYYFRRAIPIPLRALFTRGEICRSLRTSNRHNAIVQSQAFGLVTDLFFRRLGAMSKDNNDKPIRADMMLELELDGLGTLKMDMEPEEVEAGRHDYDLYLAVNDIAHTKTKARHPQTNGICERFHKTILQEFYQVAFRTKIYAGIDDLQRDLDAWINSYNNERTHQGKMCCGRTPFATMLAGKEIWNEKASALNLN